MKKQMTTVAIAMAFGAFTLNAQDLTSKKGEPILPEEGDWSIGIDATPFLNYAGNFFGKSNNNTAPSWNFLTSNNTIIGKYFKDATTAYRAGVRLGFGNSKVEVATSKRGAAPGSFPAPKQDQKNTAKYSKTGIGLTGGIEFRKGKTRLQGYYGGEVGIYFGGNKDTYTYANALNPAFSTGTAQVVVDATGDDVDGTNVTSNVVAYGQSGDARVLERKTSGILLFGLRGFIGAEYFILPKMSIGGEFGWGLIFGSNGKTTTKYETQGTPTGSTDLTSGTVTTEVKNGSVFRFDTDNLNSVFGPAATLRLNLYF
ncbi:MAG: hypothetical protein D6799_02870 [Bacteroidetes bacterium]|nr:MAG: hypothetical protein D6799_02870 [Bacteroidota bacterium]